MMASEAQEADIHNTAVAINDLTHKLHRQIEGVREWLQDEEGCVPSSGEAKAAPVRPLPLLTDTRATLADTLTQFSALARHIGAPLCE